MHTEPRLETKYFKLERLVKWEKVEEVNRMLLEDVSPRTVSKWCANHGFEISHPKLYEYKEKLQEALAKDITIERLLGIGVPKRTPAQVKVLTNTKNVVKNELEVLDAVIQMGFNALTSSPTIRIQDAIRAIELKNKLTGGNHGGFTMEGLDELRELENAKFAAIVRVVSRYLTEDQLSELETEIAKAEREYYETVAPHLLEEYDKANKLSEDELEV